jgi:sugar lactone lactonase YvrE
MNDGKCDPAGRFWAGTQSDVPDERRGHLYRLDPGGSVSRVLDGVGVSNGLDWSGDGELFYFIDTADAGIDVFAFDVKTGELGTRRRLTDVAPKDGAPDGMTLDEEGGLWVAMFGGSSVRRYTSEGALDAVIELPVTLVTSCTFGGPDFADLYVTTAAHRLTQPEPLAGALFRIQPGVRGVPCRRFAGLTE